MKFETDELHITGGIVQGQTIGGPVSLRIQNSEWPKWQEVMNSEPTQPSAKSRGRSAPLTRPRPGHADLTGMQKYGFTEARPILERASARETAARVALGAVARSFLEQLDIHVLSHTITLGNVTVPQKQYPPKPGELPTIDEDPLRCTHPATSQKMRETVDAAKKQGDTLGGTVEILAYGLPPGLGSHAHWDRRLDALIAGAIMSIQAIKGVEIGDGFHTATQPGSHAHDELRVTPAGLIRDTDRAGGIEGGMTTGGTLRVRAAMKPIATVPHALATVDVATGEPARAHHQRSDVTAVPAAAVVGEAMLALILAQATLEKFGGDNLTETRRNLHAYLDAIPRELRIANPQ